MPLVSLNPATGETIATYPSWEDEKIDAVVDRVFARNAAWRERDFAERGLVLGAAAGALRAQAEELSRLMAEEMGKPVAQGRVEVEKCAWVCDHYAENAVQYLADERVDTDAHLSLVRYQPLGTVLAVMPWNFPFWQVFRFLAPALMAGNTALLKHASSVTGCALAIERILSEAGLPEDVFRALLISSSQVARVIEDARVAAVTLTGSEPAGRAVAAAAGRSLKPSVLELGGSDPFIVLGDADLDTAAQVGVTARIQNSGQSCIAAKRFIIDAPVYDDFLRRFTAAMREVVVGDPLDPSTHVGPQARRDLREALHSQVVASADKGARIALGGAIPEGPGAFYPVTVLTDVAPGMPVFDEEVFGPVAAVIRAKDAEDAVRLANETQFGLGASLWTSNSDIAHALVDRIEAGCVFVNGMVKSDPRLPFGGIKASGYGRELASHGIREFVNVKTVWINRAWDSTG
jgi:succinate-semialdehyde dehydrogenase/glutarate-semialdehyde dehydrogenase